MKIEAWHLWAGLCGLLMACSGTTTNAGNGVNAGTSGAGRTSGGGATVGTSVGGAQDGGSTGSSTGIADPTPSVAGSVSGGGNPSSGGGASNAAGAANDSDVPPCVLSTFAQTCGGRSGAPAAQRRHAHAGRHQQFDAVAVADMEDLERFTAIAEVQSPVREHTVDIQDQQLDFGEWRGFARVQNTPARSRSCTFKAPTILPSVSITTSEVMRCVSMRCTASAARVAGLTDLAPWVMT